MLSFASGFVLWLLMQPDVPMVLCLTRYLFFCSRLRMIILAFNLLLFLVCSSTWGCVLLVGDFDECTAFISVYVVACEVG